ncbi:hypothetical protein [Nonomuraea longispora]|uniref:hypothetical protein n=1 Tax=Nonomuraea longispora TaxID=1848320 RepID=UPI0014050EC5|nr:hypothetical protein [Nonomuraea longispora]
MVPRPSRSGVVPSEPVVAVPVVVLARICPMSEATCRVCDRARQAVADLPPGSGLR